GQTPDLLHSRRAGARHRRRLDPQRLDQRRHAGGRGAAEDDRGLHLDPDDDLPPSHQDDHRAFGLLDPRGRHRAHGGLRGARPRRGEGSRLVPMRKRRLAEPGPAARHHLPAGRRTRPSAAARRRDRRRRSLGVRLRQVHRAHFSGVDDRRDGRERYSPDRGLLALRGRRDPGRRGARAAARPGHGGAGQGDAPDHRLCDAFRAGRRVRGGGGDDRHARARYRGHLRLLHGQLLYRPGRPVGAADRDMLPDRRSKDANSHSLYSRPDRARFFDRVLGSRLSAHAGGARPVRRTAPHRQLRAAIGLFVQSRRLDDVHDLCDHLRRAGLRDRPQPRHPDPDAADPDDHVQGGGRRAAGEPRGNHGDTGAVQHPGGGPAADPGGGSLPRHGPFGHQRRRQRGGKRGGGEMGGAARPARAGRYRAPSCAVPPTRACARRRALL
ncbi:MAG: Na+/H+-dicarboxylate symporters, partial [uncultured Sphingosinicella sp.]